jgi:leader peptidase (prepilin peptidase) / N-methyltransferase
MSLLPFLIGCAVLCLRGADAGLFPALWIGATGWRLALIDLRQRRLPNAVTAPALVLAASAAVLGRDPPALDTMLAAAVVLAVSWRLGAVGMGDVKLGTALAGTVHLLLGAEGLAVAVAGCAALAALLAAEAVRSGDRHIPLGPPMLLASWTALALSPTTAT